MGLLSINFMLCLTPIFPCEGRQMMQRGSYFKIRGAEIKIELLMLVPLKYTTNWKVQIYRCLLV